MAAKVGKNCKVTSGSNKVLGMGTWTVNGVTVDTLEDTEFGDSWRTFLIGLKDGGTVTFNGYYDPDNSTGQGVFRSANENGTDITDSLRLYVDATSYWTPTTTNPTSQCYITAWDVSADMNGLVQCSFTAKIGGKLELI